jgi:hypothetical protein
MTADETRTAALLFAAELAGGRLSWEEIERPEVLRAVAGRPTLAPRGRYLERFLMKRGGCDPVRRWLQPFLDARVSVLGDRALGSPRFLIRVDEFPHYRAWDEPERYGSAAFRRFHEIMRAKGIPYILAVIPRVSRRPLDPNEQREREPTDEELDILGKLRRDGVAFAAHGWSHRSRRANPRRRSELSGLNSDALDALLNRIQAELRKAEIATSVFIPPFNRFDAWQYQALARRFEIVCGGPETVVSLGFRPGPSGLAGSVYLPSYPPLYGRAETIRYVVRQLIGLRAALWVPLVLHWGWEADEGWDQLEELAAEVAPFASSWAEFIDAVGWSARMVDTHSQ